MNNVFYSLTIFLFLVTNLVFSQNEAVILLDDNQSNQPAIYEARDMVKYKPGYHFLGQNGTMIDKINEDLVLPADYVSNNQIPLVDNYSHNTNLPVGAINAIHGVTNTGAATYTVPIDVPVGTAGMMPSVSVVYNSQSGNGLLGMGWNLSAISQISRVSKNNFFDNEVEGIDLTCNDRFAIDGVRLLGNTGAYGFDGSSYKKEQHDFSNIISHSSLGNGPKYFVVKTKDGKTIEYGNDWNSRLHPSGSATVFAWYINKITDRNGNFIKYNYKRENNEVVLKSIAYTGNTNQAPYMEIKFLYEERFDDNSYYIFENKVNNTKILRRIKIINSEGECLKSYDFKYTKDQTKSFSKLIKMIEYGRNNNQKNATVFNYGNNNQLYELNDTYIGTNNNPYEYYTGDFNGDGKTDVVKCEFEYILNDICNSTSVCRAHKNYKLFTQDNTGNDFNSLGDIDITNTNNSYYYGPSGSSDQPQVDLLTSHINDFDGDGASDILVLEKDWESGSSDVFVNGFRLYRFVDGQFITEEIDIYQYTSDYNQVPLSNNNYCFQGDFNGDGNTDFITLLTVGGISTRGTIYFPSTNQADQLLIGDINLYVDIINADRVNVIDINGDGKHELLVVKNENCKVIEVFSPTPGTYKLRDIMNTNHNGFPTKWHNIKGFGDFNGDGKTDFLFNGNDFPNEYKIAYSTGSYFHEKDFITDYPENICVSDFNADGKSDIVFFDSHQNGNEIELDLYYGSGFDFSHQEQSFYNWFDSNPEVYAGDFNGDGYNEIIKRQYPVDILFHFNKNSTEKFVEKIIDGFKNKTEFDYQSIAASDIYDPCINGNCYRTFPLHVVSEYRVDNGISEDANARFNKTQYEYKGANYSKKKKAFLGFMQTKKNQLFSGKTITTNQQTYLNNTVLLPESVVITQNNGEIIQNGDVSKTEFNYNNHNYGNNCNYFYLDTKHEYDYLKGNDVFTDNTVNNQGNITNTRVEVNTNEKIIETTYTYTDAGLNMEYLPDVVTNTTTYAGQQSFTKTIDYDYENTYGRLTKKSLLEDGISINYSNFNSFGLPRKTEKSATGVATRAVEVKYDNNGRFIVEKTNALGNTSYFEYYDFGKLKKKTNISGLSTNYYYDDFGRLTKKTDPLGIETSVVFNWDGGSSIENALYYKAVQVDNLPPIKSSYDKFGRALRKETLSFGSAIYKDYLYNKKGEKTKESDPAFGNPTVWHHYSYFNDDGRIKSHTYQNRSTSYSYYHNIIDITDPANNYRQYYDASGNLLRSDYPNGNSVTNTYGSHGQVVNTNTNTSTTAMGYDNNTGYQTTLNDPNAGLTNYEYNEFGELTKQTDANGNITETILDQYGRTDYITSPEGQTNYEYVDNGNGIEQIDYIEAPNGNKIQYFYDDYDRVDKTLEKISGQNYESRYEYNSYSNIKDETYPGGFKLNYNYNNNQELVSVSRQDNGQVIWYCDDYNTDGQPVDVFLGDNGSSLKTHYDYDPETKMTSDIISGNHYNMHFEWDELTGNLQSRTDNINNLTETFQYDDADQLTDWSIGSGQSYSIQYQNTSANIDKKSDVSPDSYVYNTNKVHAVEQIPNPTSVFSLEDQQIAYNSFHKATEITEGDYRLEFEYGPNKMRKLTRLYQNNQLIKTRIFAGNYEKEINHLNGDVKEYNYISGPNGLIAVYIVMNGTGTLYYTVTDHLGSIVQLIDANGTVIEETNYGPWGRYRDPNTWQYDNTASLSMIHRGYTGHEMLPEFGLIHMNGRMYDPLLGRMLSPDNYVQDPSNPNNYNRYAYCMNNPLKYTDPDGENYMLFSALAFPLMFVADLSSNLINGVSSPVETAYNNATSVYTGMNNCLRIPVYNNGDSQLSVGLSPFAMGVSADYSYTQGNITTHIGGGLGLMGPFGSASASYSNKDWNISLGGGVGKNYFAYGGSVSYAGYGAGYYRTHYGKPNKQIVGGASLLFDDLSLKIENDFLGDGGDRWRSNALEIRYKNIMLGLYTTNNDPLNENSGVDYSSVHYDNKGNRFGTWENGQVYESPFYFGYMMGNTVHRIGYNHGTVQHLTQNKVHGKGFPILNRFNVGFQHYYLNYEHLTPGIYSYSGFYNPYSIWGE